MAVEDCVHSSLMQDKEGIASWLSPGANPTGVGLAVLEFLCSRLRDSTTTSFI